MNHYFFKVCDVFRYTDIISGLLVVRNFRSLSIYMYIWTVFIKNISCVTVRMKDNCRKENASAQYLQLSYTITLFMLSYKWKGMQDKYAIFTLNQLIFSKLYRFLDNENHNMIFVVLFWNFISLSDESHWIAQPKNVPLY